VPEEASWARHDRAWRDPAGVVSQWESAGTLDRRLLRTRASNAWWDLLDELGITLLVSREYEHVLMALAPGGRITYLRVPHPSGIAVDRPRGIVHVACTRNPNQVYDLAPVHAEGMPLLPVRTRFLPGSLYLHDLALIGGELHGNAVGQNAIVRLPEAGWYERAWWPKAIERQGGRPDFSRNYLQLNSIAAGAALESSAFSASSDTMSARRPGHLNFPVDRRGVIFDGATREPLARGLTRPHSARLEAGTLWVDNSGYGEVGVVEDGRFTAAARLDSWTRGLCLVGGVAFVGLSRVLPRFRSYAPGLEVARSRCGVVALDSRSGAVLASCTWPHGNQVFAVDWLPRELSSGLPFPATGRRASGIETRALFSDFEAVASSIAPRVRVPPADARGDVRERREHHTPVSRRAS
jgi:uncharacterized protein (TIGR03032 family)